MTRGVLNAKSVAFGGYFSCIPIFHPFPIPSPISSTTSSLSHFSPPLPFPKEINKKQLSRTVHVQRDRNTNAIPTATIILYLSVRQSRLAGCLMFSTCPFVRSSVRLFVRSSVTKLWTLSINQSINQSIKRYTSKMNESISMKISRNFTRG